MNGNGTPREVRIEVGERAYPVLIGAGLLGAARGTAQAALLRPFIAGDSVMVVSNNTVAPLYGEALRCLLGDYRVGEITLPDGEHHKNLETVARIFDALVHNRCDRDATVIALGGGVIGDIAGFAAACYQRGVALLQVPTTLLAQVDASVGGKTGVNLGAGKNLVGAFHQPRCVVIDTRTLESLPERELSSGLAEIIKYGLIRDPELFAWLEHNVEKLLRRDAAAVAHAVERSCINKAEVVTADEHDRGVRATLNLGHSFGHAIEAALDYREWLHGEAVAAGMMMAADLSRRLGWLDDAVVARLGALIERAGLPRGGPPGMTPERYLHFMAMDKKSVAGRVRLVLPVAIGEARVVADYPDEALQQTLLAFCTE